MIGRGPGAALGAAGEGGRNPGVVYTGRMRVRASLRDLIRTRDLMRACFAQPISLDDLAAEVDLSKWHYLREFRAAFGQTPHEFLTQVRLERARHLLITTSRPVIDICFDVGFSSPGSFGLLFRREMGKTPTQLRREARRLVRVPGRYPWAYVPMCFAALFGPPEGGAGGAAGAA